MSAEVRNTPVDPAEFPNSTQRGIPGQDPARLSARRAKAVTLRIAGMTYVQIAVECDYSDPAVARRAVVQALESVMVEQVEHYRALEASRYDRLTAAVWPQALRGDTKSVMTALAISARRCKLLGLDAPVVLEIHDGIDTELKALAAELATDGTFIVTDLLPEPDLPEPGA